MGDFTQVAEATVLIVICVMAFIGNGSLFWIVTRKRELRTLLNLFVLNLAAADMLVSFASMPLTAASIISEGWILERTACVAFGFITIVSFISSVMSLGMIAISRYFYIVKWQTNNTTFTIARGTLCVVFVWLTAMALASPPLFNWAEYRYIPGKSYCFVSWQADVYYMYFMIATCFFGPLTVMAISYFRILSFTRKHKKQLAIFRRKHNTQETESGPPYTRSMNTLRVSAEEAKITNTLLIVVAFLFFAGHHLQSPCFCMSIIHILSPVEWILVHCC